VEGTNVKLPRRKFLHLAAGAAALPIVSGSARAQAYPSRPVRLIVGFPPGGSADLHARLIAQWLSERLGQQFIIENRPGASTNIALQAAVNSQPDGHRGGGGDIDYKARGAWRGYGVAHSGPLK
jgi:tripartite-type tricarboxylate transporter receptor subunit TctC